MAVIDPNAQALDNFIRIGVFTNALKEKIGLIQAAISEKVPQKSDKEEGLAEMPEQDQKTCLCDQVKKIQRYTKAVDILNTTVQEIQEVTNYCVELIDAPVSKFLLKEMQIGLLQIKRTILSISVEASRGSKKILVEVTTGTGNVTTMVIAQPILILIQALQILAQAITLALQAIEMVLNLIPQILSVNPHGMCFFMTPKSMKKTDMTIANQNTSISDRVPQAVKLAIEKIEDGMAVANTAIKISTISAGAGLGLAALADEKFEIPQWVCKTMEIMTAASVMTSIDKLLLLIPNAYPLPKYEELSLTNVGFLVWLLTGFLPAGLKSFGLPV